MRDPDILSPETVALLQELQSQLTFQEDTIASLNDALAAQQRELLVLRRQVELLKQQQDEHTAALSELPGGAAPAERPPHY
ncbi:SlyX family protein [Parahaliea mediterranea]|uniref:SlyX family protein n=1 Tax=Parahaliea mediterranea TaxID=651086 RepID=A0A939IMW4_9GAMM|nr:SlyX family protein [Parahaliea mediterranea]MBN7797955.1 SlyX family protein [Parahaliea mediterranea]